MEDLKRKTGADAPRCLSDEQLVKLPDLLNQGAEHFGFWGDVWTPQTGGDRHPTSIQGPIFGTPCWADSQVNWVDPPETHPSRHISGKLLVVWDGLPVHRSKMIRVFLSQGGAKCVRLVQLPAYAPDLNPTEGIWNYLERVELKNICCHSITELRQELRKANERLRHKTAVLRGCVQQPGIYFGHLCPDQQVA